MDYTVGDIITYESFGGERRRVRVTERDSDIKNGRPGFGGTLMSHDPDYEDGVWGYDSQIVSVERQRGVRI